jgi:hypothetical protein
MTRKSEQLVNMQMINKRYNKKYLQRTILELYAFILKPKVKIEPIKIEFINMVLERRQITK